MNKWKSPDQKCGEFMKAMALRLGCIEKGWIPYCQGKIDYKGLEKIRKIYNLRIKSLIKSFNLKG